MLLIQQHIKIWKVLSTDASDSELLGNYVKKISHHIKSDVGFFYLILIDIIYKYPMFIYIIDFKSSQRTDIIII